MPVNNSQFHFNSVASLNSSNVDMNALLQKGKLSIGKHNYNVTLAKDGSVSVQREQQGANKIKNFFNSAKDQFTHRLLDNTKQSRSQRASDALSYQKREEDHINTAKLESRAPLRPEARLNAKASARPDTRLDNRTPAQSEARPNTRTSARPDTRLDNRTPVQSEARPNTRTSARSDTRLDNRTPAQPEARANTRTPARSEARTTTRANTQPRHNPSSGFTRPNTHSQVGQQARTTSEPKLDLNHFVKAQEQEAKYYGFQPNKRLAEEDYNHYLNTQKPKPASTSTPTSPQKTLNKANDNIMSYTQFRNMALDSASYHNESLNESQLRHDYRQYKNDKMMNNEMASKPVARSSSAPTTVNRYSSLLADNDLSRSASESKLSPGAADYHGYQSEGSTQDDFHNDVDELMKKYLSDD